jgi:hypothetical protein
MNCVVCAFFLPKLYVGESDRIGGRFWLLPLAVTQHPSNVHSIAHFQAAHYCCCWADDDFHFFFRRPAMESWNCAAIAVGGAGVIQPPAGLPSAAVILFSSSSFPHKFLLLPYPTSPIPIFPFPHVLCVVLRAHNHPIPSTAVSCLDCNPAGSSAPKLL